MYPFNIGIIGSQKQPVSSLLLDVYPGAGFAVSFRKLSSSYTGNCVRVRRASDNTEQDIAFVNNYIDTASLQSFCSGTDGYIKTWYDQSGNGKNTTQTDTSLQPQIVSSGTVITLGGKVAGKFTGTTFLQTTSNVTSASFFSIHKFDTSGSNGIPIGFGLINNNANTYAFGMLDNSIYLVQNSSLDYANQSSAPSSYWGHNIWYGNYTNMQMWRNNTQLTLNIYGGDGSAPGPVDLVVTGKRGIGTGMIGNIQEQIVYNSLPNNTAMTTEMNNYYSVYTP